MQDLVGQAKAVGVILVKRRTGRTRTLLLLSMLCVSGCQNASPVTGERTAVAFADGKVAITLPSTVNASAAKRMDFDIVDVKDAAGPLLRIYAGNHPQGIETAGPRIEETIGGRSSITHRWVENGTNSRLTLVTVENLEWPRFVQFYYRQISPTRSAIADGVIASLTIIDLK